MPTLNKNNKKGVWKRCKTKYCSKKRRGERKKYDQARLMSNDTAKAKKPKPNPDPPHTTVHQTKKVVCPGTYNSHNHHRRSMDSPPMVSVHEAPPTRSNFMYKEYIQMMALPLSTTLGCKLLTNDCHRPSYVPSLKQLRTHTFPKWVQHMMETGVVKECQLHSTAFSTHAGKFKEYNSEEHTLKVRVPFAYLESILIPFDDAPPRKKGILGTVPLKFQHLLNTNTHLSMKTLCSKVHYVLWKAVVQEYSQGAQKDSLGLATTKH